MMIVKPARRTWKRHVEITLLDIDKSTEVLIGYVRVSGSFSMLHLFWPTQSVQYKVLLLGFVAVLLHDKETILNICHLCLSDIRRLVVE